MKLEEYKNLTPELEKDIEFLMDFGFDIKKIQDNIDFFKTYSRITKKLIEIYNGKLESLEECQRTLLKIIKNLNYFDNNFKIFKTKTFKNEIKNNFGDAAAKVLSEVDKSKKEYMFTQKAFNDYFKKHNICNLKHDQKQINNTNREM